MNRHSVPPESGCDDRSRPLSRPPRETPMRNSRTSRRAALLAAAATLLAGTALALPPTATAAPITAGERAQVVVDGLRHQLGDERTAGTYFDGTGRLVVAVTDQ